VTTVLLECGFEGRVSLEEGVDTRMKVPQAGWWCADFFWGGADDTS
jgi:hypothetical protein